MKEKRNMKTTTVWQVRKLGTTWKRSFNTRKEARECIKKSWQFKENSIILKITTERVS
jgi:hypothetical protein